MLGKHRAPVAIGIVAVVVLLAAAAVAVVRGGDNGGESHVASAPGTTVEVPSTTVAESEPSSTTSTSTASSTAAPAAAPRPASAAPKPAAKTCITSPPVLYFKTTQPQPPPGGGAVGPNEEGWMMGPDGCGQHKTAALAGFGTAGGNHGGYSRSFAGWSPDGQRFVVLHCQSGFGMPDTSADVYDRSGAIKSKFHVASGECASAAWAPDGIELAASFKSEPDCSTNPCQFRSGVRILDASTGRTVRDLSPSPCGQGSLAWAPSPRLAIVGDDSMICTMDPDGKNVRHLAAKVTGGGSPHWFPDRRILFPTDGMSAVIRDANGAVPERVCGYGPDQALSLDGAYVAVAVARENGADLNVCPTGGGTTTIVPDGVNPAFDSTGRVLFTKSGGGVWRVNVDGSDRRQLADGHSPAPAPK